MPEPTYEDVYEPPILDSTGQAIANAIQGLNPTVPSFISDAFSVERNYSKGDICIYDNKVYEFTSAKSAGAWDSTKVTQTTIGAVCTSLSNSLTQLQNSEIKVSRISTTVTTMSSAGFTLNTLALALGELTLTSQTGYPTGKTIVSAVCITAANSTNRAITCFNSTMSTLYVFGKPSTQYTVVVDMFYKEP